MSIQFTGPADLAGLDFSNPEVTIAGYPCFELTKGLSEELGATNGAEISKSYLIRWADRYAFANACLGYSTLSGGRGGTVTFHRPVSHPEAYNCFAQDVRLTPVGQPTTNQYGLAYPMAAVTLVYRNLPFGINGSLDQQQNAIDDSSSFVYATQSLQIGGEPMEYPASCLSLQAITSSGPGIATSPTHGYTLMCPNAVLRITFMALPYFPVNTLPYQNCVNATDGFLGCKKGTCKFVGSDVNRTIQSNGDIAQELTNTYMYRPVADWNWVINPNPLNQSQIWSLLSIKTSPVSYPYPYKDLTQTFPNPAYSD